MSDETDGLSIALERIANEAREKTGSLDLGQLDLTELPEELFRLTHLRALTLGIFTVNESDLDFRMAVGIGDNTIWNFNHLEGKLQRISELRNLVSLGCFGIFNSSLDAISELIPSGY
jgi:hypothetical protein